MACFSAMRRFHELTLVHAWCKFYNSDACKKCSTCSYFAGCYAFQSVFYLLFKIICGFFIHPVGCLLCLAFFHLCRRGFILDLALTKKFTDNFSLFVTFMTYVTRQFIPPSQKMSFFKMAAQKTCGHDNLF